MTSTLKSPLVIFPKIVLTDQLECDISIFRSSINVNLSSDNLNEYYPGASIVGTMVTILQGISTNYVIYIPANTPNISNQLISQFGPGESDIVYPINITPNVRLVGILTLPSNAIIDDLVDIDNQPINTALDLYNYYSTDFGLIPSHAFTIQEKPNVSFPTGLVFSTLLNNQSFTINDPNGNTVQNMPSPSLGIYDIVGIAVGSVLVIIIILLLIYFRKRSGRKLKDKYFLKK